MEKKMIMTISILTIIIIHSVLNGGYNLLGSIFRNNDSLTTAIDQPIVDPILNGTLGAGWITFVRLFCGFIIKRIISLTIIFSRRNIILI
jgi:hypothetical protein